MLLVSDFLSFVVQSLENNACFRLSFCGFLVVNVLKIVQNRQVQPVVLGIKGDSGLVSHFKPLVSQNRNKIEKNRIKPLKTVQTKELKPIL